MKKEAIRMKLEKAKEKAYDRGIETILQATYCGNFCEIIGTIGGDVLRLRIYDDGSMYEK